MLDEEARTSYVNRRMADMLGYTVEEMQGRLMFDFMDAVARAEAERNFQKRRQGVMEQHDFRFRRKDGTDLWTIVSAAPVLDENGSFISVLGMITDITERKRAEDALRESEERYRLVVEHSPDPVAIHSEGIILYVNPAAVELFGASSPEDLIGKPISDTVHPDSRKGFTERMQRIWEVESLGLTENRLLRFNGEAVDVESTSIPFTYQGKRAILSVARDITERVRAREARMQLQLRLVEAQEDERRRIARELHDQLGQYFPALMMGLEALRSEARNRKALTERLQQLQDLSERIARDVHGISRDLRSSELEDFGIQTALASYVENWSERHGIVVDFYSAGFEEDERFARHVETTLYRIVQEALTNVLKHAEARRVSLILEHRDGYAVAVIEDDGKGFDAEAVMNAPMTERRLGLLGMQERVALVGGTLEIESSPGAGTTVVARVPTTTKEVA